MTTKKPTKAQRVKAFRQAIRKSLQPMAPKLDRLLSTLVSHEYPENFWQLDFEIFYNADELSVVTYFYRPKFDQIFNGDADARLFPFNACDQVQRATRLRIAAFRRKFQIRDDESWFEEAAVKEVVPWFHRGWVSAGG